MIPCGLGPGEFRQELREGIRETLEGAGPPLIVLIAVLLFDEDLLGEGHQRGVARVLQIDPHDGFMASYPIGVPGPSEDSVAHRV